MSRKALRMLYATLPTINCKGLCYQECQHPVAAWPIERREMERTTGKPYVYHTVEHRCTYLNAARQCEAHDVRPYVCRAYGTADTMRCAFGCETTEGTYLTDAQAADDFRTLDQLSGNRTMQKPKAVR